MNFNKLKKSNILLSLIIIFSILVSAYLLVNPTIRTSFGLIFGRKFGIFISLMVFLFLLLISWFENKLTKKRWLFVFTKDELLFLLLTLSLFILSFFKITNLISEVLLLFITLSLIALFLTSILAFLNKWFSKVDKKLGKISKIILFISILIFIVLYTKLCFLRFNAGFSNIFDLGNMEQTVWNTLHGNFFRMTTVDGLTNRLGAHADVFLVLLAPFYALWSSPKMLIFAQILILGIGAWPLFLIAKKLLKSSIAGLVFAFAYLISPIVGAALLFDFHAVTLVAPFLFFAFYFLLEKKYIPYFVFIVLALTCKEEISLLIILFGIYVYFKHNKKLGIATSLLGLSWLLIVFFIVMPHFRQGASYIFLDRYAYLDINNQGMIKAFFSNPFLVIQNIFQIDKLIYFLYLILPFGGLMLFSGFVLLGLPTFLINIMSGFGPMFSGGYHYSTPLLFYLTVGSIYGIKFWLKKIDTRKVILYSFLSFIFLSSLFFGYKFRFTLFGPQGERFNANIVVTEHNKKIYEVKKMIPADASVSTLGVTGVYLAARKDIYIFPMINNASYVVLEQPGWSNLPVSREEYENEIKDFRKNSAYQIIYEDKDYLVFKKR